MTVKVVANFKVTLDRRGPPGPRAPQEVEFGGQGPLTPTDYTYGLGTYPNGGITRTFQSAKSRFWCSVAPTADCVFSVKVNGVQIATVTFLAGHTTGTLSVTSFILATNDVLSVFGPSVPDSTMISPTLVFSEDV